MIAKNEKLANTDIAHTRDLIERYYAEISLYALEHLKSLYEQHVEQAEGNGKLGAPIKLEERDRVRSRNILSPNDNSTNPSGMDSHNTSPDDEV